MSCSTHQVYQTFSCQHATVLAVYKAILLALVSVLGVGLLLMGSFNGVAMHLYVCICVVTPRECKHFLWAQRFISRFARVKTGKECTLLKADSTATTEIKENGQLNSVQSTLHHFLTD